MFLYLVAYMSVSVIYWCITNHPKIQWFKITSFCYLHHSVNYLGPASKMDYVSGTLVKKAGLY